MPRDNDLPVPLKPLARRQAQELSDARWDRDLEELVELLVSLPVSKSPITAATARRLRLVRAFDAAPRVATSVAYAPDGATLAVGGDDGRLRLWRPADARPLGEWGQQGASVTDVEFTRDGAMLGATSVDGILRLWRTGDGALVRTLEPHPSRGAMLDWLVRADEDFRPIAGLAFTPDGALVAAGCADGRVRLWRTADGAPVRKWWVHDGGATSVTFVPDGELLVSGGHDGWVGVWRVSSGKRVYGALSDPPITLDNIGMYTERAELTRKIKAHPWRVTMVAVHPDGSMLAAGYGDALIRLWTLATGALAGTLLGHSSAAAAEAGYSSITGMGLGRASPMGAVNAVAFSPDGTLLASGGDDASILLWRVGTGELLNRLTPSPAGVTSLAFSPEGQTLASASWDGSVGLWGVTS